jgi:hypothetical protein
MCIYIARPVASVLFFVGLDIRAISLISLQITYGLSYIAYW